MPGSRGRGKGPKDAVCLMPQPLRPQVAQPATAGEGGSGGPQPRYPDPACPYPKPHSLRSRCLPRSWPAVAAAVATVQAPAQKARMTAPWNCLAPNPAAPVPANPSDIGAAAPAWHASLALLSGPLPVSAVVPAGAPHPRTAGCLGEPLTGAIVVVAGAAVRRGLLGCLVPGLSHQLCLAAWACFQPCAWRLQTLVAAVAAAAAAPGKMSGMLQLLPACLPAPMANRG